MKKLSLVLLLSCLSVGISYTNPEAESVEAVEAESRCCGGDCRSAEVDAGLTWEVVRGSNCVYIELARTDATDESWAQICELVEQSIPESRACQVGAESNTLSCTVKRGDLVDGDWDLNIATVISRVKELITILQDSGLSGATVQVYITNLAE